MPSDRHDAGAITPLFRQKLREEGIIWRSAAMANVVRCAEIVAASSKNVLLSGETGTGKWRIARFLHANGPRRDGPLVEVACPALPDSECELALFGTRSGAGMGLERDRVGAVSIAEHGTLLLQEVSSLPLRAQGKLQQLLQSGHYQPAGSASTVEADIRVIATTIFDQEERRFWLDLLYRLDVCHIRVPSLGERREDIAELAVAFCVEACRAEGHGVLLLSREGLRALEAAEWPGNVRQLGHVVEKAVYRAIADGAVEIGPRHLAR